MNRLQNANSRATAFVGKRIENVLCHDCRDCLERSFGDGHPISIQRNDMARVEKGR